MTRGDDFAGKVRLTGLRPATRYGVQVRSGGETARGEFTTAPPHDQPARVTFLWSGDLGGGGRCRLADGGYRIFRAMTPHRPDFFLFAGDTIYADVKCDKPGVLPGADFIATTLTGFRGRHRYNREDPAVQDFFKTTSVYAIWDDHEVRNNFSGPTEPLMVTGRRAFLEYWPVSPPDEEPTRLSGAPTATPTARPRPCSAPRSAAGSSTTCPPRRRSGRSWCRVSRSRCRPAGPTSAIRGRARASTARRRRAAPASPPSATPS
ncbi:MAG: alkaline phosphatase D family protein [Candidatus Rokubacteria bacterium]|nr:alkaline phosphatase D family protein [Candidatus Rokubacteria bacterium]